MLSVTSLAFGKRLNKTFQGKDVTTSLLENVPSSVLTIVGETERWFHLSELISQEKLPEKSYRFFPEFPAKVGT